MNLSVILDLIRVAPFLVAAVVLAMASRGMATGELKCGGGRSRVRTVVRSESPVEFWVEMVLHVVVVIFCLAFGLLFTGHAPPWLKELLFQLIGSRHR
jgi:hypothetical protein